MLQSLGRPALAATVALALSGCGDVSGDIPPGGSIDGVRICSTVIQTPVAGCGTANMYLCNDSDRTREARVTRQFAFGEPEPPYVQVHTVPARASTLNGTAKSIGRDEYPNKNGRCVPVNYDFRLL